MKLIGGPTEDPWWAELLPSFRRLAAPERYGPYVDGYVFPAPVAEMPIYLKYVRSRFLTMGGKIVQRHVDDISETFPGHSLVVNCSGLGAVDLMADSLTKPVRGQVVRTSLVGLDEVVIDFGNPASPTYIVLRSEDSVLGGTCEDGATNLAADATVAEAW
ncbi:FAD-dependent oxidoreductase [Nocardia sp. NPDC049190]|uniref:FAD-dependent oxidoreductase n=1 Tax=Nocardia sp. NPDC049190 TaxID=3155650 RepID=UPI0033CC82A6